MSEDGYYICDVCGQSSDWYRSAGLVWCSFCGGEMVRSEPGSIQADHIQDDIEDDAEEGEGEGGDT